jgi:hypothetical protein
MAGNKMGGGRVPVASEDIDDILEGFAIMNEYFRTPDDDEVPEERIGKGKGGRKAA